MSVVRSSMALASFLLVASACAEEPPPVVPMPVVTEFPECEYPAEIPFPRWVPKDFPFPRGTYAYERLEPLLGYRRGLFVVRVNLPELAEFVDREFPRAGYEVVRSEQEIGEMEADFQKGMATGGLRAQQAACRPGYMAILLVYARRPPDRPISLVPSPGPSPS